LKKKEETKELKRGKDKMLGGKYGYDPMCGPIRP